MMFVDLFGDGNPALLAMSGGKLGNESGRGGYFVLDPKDPTLMWSFHPISWPADEFQWYAPGFGYGDVNGDGRMDVLHSDGWWEQPKSLPCGLTIPILSPWDPGEIKQYAYSLYPHAKD